MNSAFARALVCGAALVLTTAGITAQQRREPERRVDPLTASIHGRVTAADTGAPIRRAEVRALSDGGINRLTTTDADGRFELRDLPAASYRVAVSRSGFVPSSFGQQRPFESVRTIDLKEGERFVANMAVVRGGAIEGRIYDDAGEPVSDVRVQVLRSRVAEGTRRISPIGVADVTDDRGAFRLYGVPPGEYYVAANLPRAQPPGQRDSQMSGPVRGSATLFFPGTPNIAEAQRVRVGPGAEARADMYIAAIRTAIVSGIVISAAGGPGNDATVSLQSDVISMGFSMMYGGPPPLSIDTHTEPDGSFVLPNVPPGSYTLSARVQPRAFGLQIPDTGAPPPIEAILSNEGETGSMHVVVGDGDVSGLTLTTSRGGVIVAEVVADAGATRPIPRGIDIEPVTASSSQRMGSLGGNGRRWMMGVGPTRLRVTGLPDDWTIKAILAEGKDVTDEPIPLKNGVTVNVRVVLTDRVTEIAGTIDGAASSRQYNVIVFPEDSSKWTYPSRFIRVARTDDRGAFQMGGLSGNTRYLAVAVDYLEDGESEDPEFLEQMKSRATSFSLADSERKTIAVRVVSR